MDIKPLNPPPPVSAPKKIDRQNDSRRDDKARQRRPEDRNDRDEDQSGIDTYA